MNNCQRLEEIRARLPDGDDYGRRLCDELMADEEKVLVERAGVLVYGGDGIGWALHTGLIFPSQVPHLHKSRDVPVTVIIKETKP